MIIKLASAANRMVMGHASRGKNAFAMGSAGLDRRGLSEKQDGPLGPSLPQRAASFRATGHLSPCGPDRVPLSAIALLIALLGLASLHL